MKKLYLDNLKAIYGAVPAEPSHQPCDEQLKHAAHLELPITIELAVSGIRLVLTPLHGYISETYITEEQFIKFVKNPEKNKIYYAAGPKKPFRFASQNGLSDFLIGLATNERVEIGRYHIGDPSWLRSVTLAGLGSTYPWRSNCDRLNQVASYRKPISFWKDFIEDPPLPDVCETHPTPWGVRDAIGLVRCFTTKYRTQSWRSALGSHRESYHLVLSGSWKTPLRDLDPEKRDWIYSTGSGDHDVGFRILFQLKKRYFKDSYLTKDI